MAPSIQDQKNQAREYIKLTQTNSVQLAGTCIQKSKREGKIIMKDNVPQIDKDGNVQRYKDNYSVKVSFNGGEIETPVNEDQYAKIQEGEMYLFKGRLGLVKSFGNESISYVFSTVEEI